jgi:hypothetical protein
MFPSASQISLREALLVITQTSSSIALASNIGMQISALKIEKGKRPAATWLSQTLFDTPVSGVSATLLTQLHIATAPNS